MLDWLVVGAAAFMPIFAIVRDIEWVKPYEEVGIYLCLLCGMYIVAYLYRNRKLRYSATVGTRHIYIRCATHPNGKLIEYSHLESVHLHNTRLTLGIRSGDVYWFDFPKVMREDIVRLEYILTTRAHDARRSDVLRHLIE